MARDFDFVRKQVVAAQPVPVAPVQQRQPRRPPRSLGVGIFLGLVVLGLGFLSQTLPAHNTTTKSVASDQTTVASLEATPSPSTVTSAEMESPLQIYDSGGGETAVKEIIEKLAGAQIVLKNLGRSQFEYDKTYVWFAPGKEELAKQIVGQLGSRQVVTKESKIAGGFDVMIYLGKN